MVDPLLSLIVGALVLALVIVLFWPVRGLAWRWARGRQAADRVRVEDALKHLWDGEYRRQPSSLSSLAGTLGLSGRAAAELVERLERLELVALDAEGLRLTDAGRREALRVVRIHRLWERYLADETGLDAARWHAEAERLEHRTSAEQADRMEAVLGYPRFDPHGDPIPMGDGEVPPAQGVPLTALRPGEVAEIIHVEDEPEAVFAQIAAAGLAPGGRVRLLESTPGRLRIAADVDEIVLAPVVAANLTVQRLEQEVDRRPAVPLSALAPGESAEVVGIAPACRGVQRRRLFDLGVVPGTVVANELSAPGGDPTAYRIRGALIALRREQADLIHVHRREVPGAERKAS
jgi:DtxR family Mn-dependent transcriptional regulator